MKSMTTLTTSDKLPLTCSRTGTCCHGKMVWLNPWELRSLANAKSVTPQQFRGSYTDFGGIRLRFDGDSTWNGMSSCSQYTPNFGCDVHTGRPLACRLYPLGLHRQGETVQYIYQGKEFPCLNGCPEVEQLPSLTVEEYIDGQKAELFRDVQTQYLTLMESLADGAFALLIDSGLAATGDTETLQTWRTMGNESAQECAERIGNEWIDRLMIPAIESSCEDPSEFIEKHHKLLQTEAQALFGALETVESFRDASVHMMALALHLGRALGAKPSHLVDQWIATAKEHGATE